MSLWLFGLLWPLLAQRRLLMPLVQPKGIYWFSSKQLIKALASMIGDRRCLEIAAGDGTLSRFLSDEGVAVTATDDYSWSNSVQTPSSSCASTRRRRSPCTAPKPSSAHGPLPATPSSARS